MVRVRNMRSTSQTSRPRLLARARAGDVAAQTELGGSLYFARPARKRQAMFWWQKAARADDTKAQYFLARCYDQGIGVRRDSWKARAWWERAAALGCVPALRELGVACAEGKGGPRDRARAKRLYGRAAAAGDEQAMCALGKVYAEGLGVPKSVRRAFEWFRKAAARGDGEAALQVLELAEEHGLALDRRAAAR